LSASKDTPQKQIINLELGHKFFTPDGITFRNAINFDRPYAGLLYVSAAKARFLNRKTRINYGVQLGTTGRPSLAADLQIWYHNAVGFKRPAGWGFQIRTALVLNIFGAYNKQFSLLPGRLDLISSTGGSIGTGFTNAYQNLDLRIGQLNDLDISPFFNAVIGRGSQNFGASAYFYVGYGLTYVAHDITTEGSLFNDNSPHTVGVVPWNQGVRIGLATSSNDATFKVTFHWISKEVKTARDNSYLSLMLALRFKNK
jgi:lipid A 3-O-deacylase